MARQRIYLDWNASAPLLPAARAAVLSALDLTGNASSVHGEGRQVRALLETARRDVAALCGADAAHVVLTSGATEAANLVLTPDFQMGKSPMRLSKLFVSAIEHAAIREGGRFARSDVRQIPVTGAGTVDLDALARLLASVDRSQGLPMVALMLANNETGIVQPVAEAARIVHAAGGLLVVDAVQAAGRLAIDIATLDADFLILSSHKIGGPKGAGALVARGSVLMPMPLVHGGGQERGHRSGTENVAAIAGFGAAARHAATRSLGAAAEILARRDHMETGMRRAAPDLVIHGEGELRLPNTSYVTLPGLKAETGQIAFDIDGVALSAGAACSSGKVGQSHVLAAMGLDAGHGALRISIGETTTDAEIEAFVTVFEKIAARRRLASVAA